MKKYVSPSSYSTTRRVVNNSSFKQVANSFSRGFSRGVSAGLRGNSEHPVSLQPVEAVSKV